MSESRSTTPTPNTFSTNLTSSPKSTTSRTSRHAHFPSVPPLEGGDQSSQSSQVHSLPSHSPVAPNFTSRDQQMARHLRPESSGSHSPMPFEEPSPSTDSQHESPEIERRDAQQNQPEHPVSEFAEYSTPPPKKKRTRTLTTPHQAAVLHALLAKSRFPNTAMREEVGRSIGLSARKVQIWFQNQRQKARRPRTQNEADSQKRSPQYGAFPSGPDGPVVGSFPFVPEQSSSSRTLDTDDFHDVGGSRSRRHRSPEPHSEAIETPSQLLGPGMPGAETSSELPYHGHPGIPLRPSTAHEQSTRFNDPRYQSFRPPSPPRLHLPLPISRPATASGARDSIFSRTLPPLVFPPPPHTGLSAHRPPSGAFTSAYVNRRSLSPEGSFADKPLQPPSAPPIALSPPYAVQPRPHWDTSFGPALRSSHSQPWTHREHQSAERSVTPPRPVTEGGTSAEAPRSPEENTSNTETRPPGRYDPVRATFIYSSSSSPKDEK